MSKIETLGKSSSPPIDVSKIKSDLATIGINLQKADKALGGNGDGEELKKQSSIIRDIFQGLGNALFPDQAPRPRNPGTGNPAQSVINNE